MSATLHPSEEMTEGLVIPVGRVEMAPEEGCLEGFGLLSCDDFQGSCMD